MRREFIAAAPLTAVILLGAGAAALVDAAWKSVTLYRTPYAIEADLPSGEPLTERLLLVVMDGIRLDVSRRMPNLKRLAARGAAGVARVGTPSLSFPARATISTGAWPEIHGVTDNGRHPPPPIDSIFSLAAKLGLPRASFGSEFWRDNFGDALADRREFDKEIQGVDDPQILIDWQRKACAEMVPFFAARPRGLFVVGLTASDSAGHDFGGASEAYRRVAKAVDECLGKLAAALDDPPTTFVVTSDHGHIDRRGRGGHGGAEPEVLEVPLVLAGKGIRRSTGWRAMQTDIAPTIAILLGLPLPANSQGRVLWEAIEAPEKLQQAARKRERDQQELLESRLPDRGEALSEERRERRAPALAAAIALCLIIGFSAARNRDRLSRLVLSIGVYLAVYSLLFWLLGLGYSLSAIIQQEYLYSFFGRDVAAAAAAFGAAALALGDPRRRGAESALLLSALMGLRVAYAYWDAGLMMRRFMPDITVAFRAYLDLLAMFGVALGAVVFVAAAWLAEKRRKGT